MRSGHHDPVGVQVLKYATRLIGLVTCALVAAMVVLALHTRVAQAKGDATVTPPLVILASCTLVAGAIGIFLFVYVHAKLYLKPSDSFVARPTATTLPESGWCNEVRMAFSANLQAIEIGALVRSTLAMRSLTQRIVESVELGESTITRHVTRTLEIPTEYFEEKPEVASLIIPVVRQKKGQLIDDLEIKIDEKPTDSLSYLNNVGATLTVLRYLFDNLIGEFKNVPENIEEIYSIFERLAAHPLSMVDTQAFTGAIDELNSAIETEKENAGLIESGAELVRAAIFLTSAYPVYCVVDLTTRNARNRRVIVQTSRQQRIPHSRRGLSRRARRYSGLPVYEFNIGIPEAVDTPSYHLRAKAPEGTYLYAATPRLRDGTGRAWKPTGTQTPFILELSPTFGTSNLHAYSRGLGDAIESDRDSVRTLTMTEGEFPTGLFIRATFRPVPPGLSLAIFLLSLYLTIISSSVALFHDTFFGRGASTATATILGVPAIMSAWVASRFDAKGVKHASPSMIAELTSLLTISLLAVGVTVAKVSESISSNGESSTKLESFPHPFPDPLTGHPWWALVWVLSLTQCFVSGLSLSVRIWMHGKALAVSAKAENSS